MRTYQEEVNLLFISDMHNPFQAEISAKELEINWGNGNPTVYKDNPLTIITHQFQTEGLQHIKIRGTEINSLNLSHLSLKTLSVINCKHLEYLDCSVNELNALDLTECSHLEELYCNSNNLQKLDLSNLTALQQANLSYNGLQNIDIRPCKALKILYCSNNQLTQISIGKNNSLRHLDVSNNLLEKESLNQLSVILKRSNPYIILCRTQNPESK